MWPSIREVALPGDSQYCNYARRHIENQAANTIAKAHAEIHGITRQIINDEQPLLAAQHVIEDIGPLIYDLAKLQSERMAKKGV